MNLFRKKSLHFLLTFSSSHSALRRASIEAGLFSHVIPKSSSNGIRKFGLSLIQLHPRRSFTSVRIDLENPQVWEICEIIMKQSPSVNEICLLGDPEQLAIEFCRSELGERLAYFRRNSIVLRRATFSPASLSILGKIGSEKIISLFFDQSKIYFGKQHDHGRCLRWPLSQKSQIRCFTCHRGSLSSRFYSYVHTIIR